MEERKRVRVPSSLSIAREGQSTSDEEGRRERLTDPRVLHTCPLDDTRTPSVLLPVSP